MNNVAIEVEAWQDNPETQNSVREKLQPIIQRISEANSLDLSRLLGVTVTDRIDDALADFDDGGIQNGRILTRTSGAMLGVASTPVCNREGRAFCRIFLRAEDVIALLQSNDPVSRYILAHELGHANDLAQKCKTVEHIALDTPGDEMMPPVVWQIADIIWNEYAACRKSGTEHPGILLTMYSSLDRALTSFTSDIRLMAGVSQTAESLQPVLDIATETLEPILKYSTYVLGHRAALAQGPFPLPTELETLLQANGFRTLYEELSDILGNMWELHGAWHDESVYGPLLDFVRRAYAACGLNMYLENGHMKVVGIHSVLTAIISSPAGISL